MGKEGKGKERKGQSKQCSKEFQQCISHTVTR